MQKNQQAYLYAAIAIFLWSTVATAFKIALELMSPFSLLLIAAPISAVSLLVIIIFTKRVTLFTTLHLKSIFIAAVAGLLNPFFYYLILFKAYDILPAQQAQPLNYTWPIMLSLLSIPFLKQNLSRNSVIGLMLSFLGVILIASKGDFQSLISINRESLWGISLALFSSVVWALFWIINVKNSSDSIIMLFLNFFFGTVYLILTALFLNEWPELSLSGFLSASYVGLFEMGITFFVWSKALKLSPSSAKVGQLIYFAPFLSLFFIAVILGEKIIYTSILGLAIIILGVILSKREKKS